MTYKERLEELVLLILEKGRLGGGERLISHNKSCYKEDDHSAGFFLQLHRTGQVVMAFN